MHTQWQDGNRKRFQGREEKQFSSMLRQILRIAKNAFGSLGVMKGKREPKLLKMLVSLF